MRLLPSGASDGLALGEAEGDADLEALGGELAAHRKESTTRTKALEAEGERLRRELRQQEREAQKLHHGALKRQAALEGELKQLHDESAKREETLTGQVHALEAEVHDLADALALIPTAAPRAKSSQKSEMEQEL